MQSFLKITGFHNKLALRVFIALLSVLIFSAGAAVAAQKESVRKVSSVHAGKNVPPYKNPNLPIEERVRDLLSRMTLQEKARQLDMYP